MNDLIKNIDKLHTTEMVVDRIKHNLSIEVDDVVQWCKIKILDAYSTIKRKGENWYVYIAGCEITVKTMNM